MAKTVIGILENPSAAQQAVDELLKSGFERRDIGLISSDIMREAATAATGASKGMAFGALAGMLLSAATMMIPGLGPILVAGPGLTLLGGTTLGALAGGIVGALKARGVPEEQANFYAEGVRRGGTLITVNAKTDALAERAIQILKSHGAVDIEQRVADWKRFGWTGRLGRITQRAKKGAEAKPAQASSAARPDAERPAQAQAKSAAGKPAAEEPVEAQTTEAVPVVPLAAVEVYSLVIEMPDNETATADETATAEEAGSARRAERRRSAQPYSGAERRQAASAQ
jgi:hypothetical protein